VSDPSRPGAIVTSGGSIHTSEGRPRRTLTVTSTSARPVRVSSHYPFWRANQRLAFDRDAARGFRLDIPAGESLRWAPGETREVTLVALARSEPGDG
jgi:urease subunit gamma/beta